MSKVRIDILSSTIIQVSEQAQHILAVISDVESRLQLIESQMSRVEHSISRQDTISTGYSTKHATSQHVLRTINEIMGVISKLEVAASELERRMSTIESHQDK